MNKRRRRKLTNIINSDDNSSSGGSGSSSTDGNIGRGRRACGRRNNSVPRSFAVRLNGQRYNPDDSISSESSESSDNDSGGRPLVVRVNGQLYNPQMDEDTDSDVDNDNTNPRICICDRQCRPAHCDACTSGTQPCPKHVPILCSTLTYLQQSVSLAMSNQLWSCSPSRQSRLDRVQMHGVSDWRAGKDSGYCGR